MGSYFIPMIVFAVIAILAVAHCALILFTTKMLAAENAVMRRGLLALQPPYVTDAMSDGLWLGLRLLPILPFSLTPAQLDAFYDEASRSVIMLLRSHQEAVLAELRRADAAPLPAPSTT